MPVRPEQTRQRHAAAARCALERPSTHRGTVAAHVPQDGGNEQLESGVPERTLGSDYRDWPSASGAGGKSSMSSYSRVWLCIELSLESTSTRFLYGSAPNASLRSEVGRLAGPSRTERPPTSTTRAWAAVGHRLSRAYGGRAA